MTMVELTLVAAAVIAGVVAGTRHVMGKRLETLPGTRDVRVRYDRTLHALPHRSRPPVKHHDRIAA
jgi:hypothetical protein